MRPAGFIFLLQTEYNALGKPQIQQCGITLTAQNPADHASRGLKISDLINSTWLRGPSFLWEREIIAPKSTPERMLGYPEIKTICVF